MVHADVCNDWAVSFQLQNFHIDELCKKLSKRIGLLKYISSFLKQRQKETYYNGVIKPTLLYGSMIWGNCNLEYLQNILKFQKRAARIILDAERLTPSVVLFNNLNWIPFTKQSLIKRCAQVYKQVHNYSGAPAARRAAKRSPIVIAGKNRKPMKDFLMVIMASGIARGRVRKTTRRRRSRATWRPYSKK